MFNAQHSLHRVPYDGSFRIAEAPTSPDGGPDKSHKKRLKRANEKLDEMQRVLMARDRHAVLLVFQAMDAAGKDSTIRAVTAGHQPGRLPGVQLQKALRPGARSRLLVADLHPHARARAYRHI